jgi:hypothetical protein
MSSRLLHGDRLKLQPVHSDRAVTPRALGIKRKAEFGAYVDGSELVEKRRARQCAAGAQNSLHHSGQIRFVDYCHQKL